MGHSKSPAIHNASFKECGTLWGGCGLCRTLSWRVVCSVACGLVGLRRMSERLDYFWLLYLFLQINWLLLVALRCNAFYNVVG